MFCFVYNVSYKADADDYVQTFAGPRGGLNDTGPVVSTMSNSQY